MNNIAIKILILLVSVFSINIAQAQHFAGGEISYVNIGGNSYKVTYTYYHLCTGAASPTSVNLNFSCDSNSSLNFQSNAVKLGTYEITSACPSNITSCGSGGGNVFGVTNVSFETTVTLPPCGNWEISYYTGSRKPISYVAGSSSIYIRVRLNNSVVNNTSPIFYNFMLPVIYKNSETFINCGAYDIDGDSLSYSLCAPLVNTSSQTMIYNIPYSATNFMDTQTPIILDTETGVLRINSTASTSGHTTGMYGVYVEEWRNINGVMTKIGDLIRDFSVEVIDGNTTPTLGGFNFSDNSSYSQTDTVYDIYRCYDSNPVTFRINGFDADINSTTASNNQKIFDISWNNQLDNTVFTAHNNGTDSAYGEFVWTPDSNDINIKKSFVVNVQDSACPYNAINSQQYYITLINADVEISNDTSVCYGAEVIVNSTYDNNYYNEFNWSIDGLAVNGSVNSDSLIISTQGYISGDYIVELVASDIIMNSGCIQTKQMVLTIEPPLFPDGYFSDTAYCDGDIVIFDAGEADSYKWIDETGALQSTNRYYSPFSSGLVVVEAYKNTCIEMGVFNVLIHNPPAFNLGNDTTITNNDIITLSMPYGYADYLWSDGSTNQTLLIDNTFDWQNIITGRILEGGICPSSDTIIVKIGSVGIAEIKKSDINIFPNPVNDVLNIQLNNNYEKVILQLFDINSKLLRNEEFSGKGYILDGLGELSAGNYFLKITIDEGLFEYKIIKK